MTERTVTFTKNKETKNTVRYQETGLDIIIGPLYIQKSFLGDTIPETVTVTVSYNI